MSDILKCRIKIIVDVKARNPSFSVRYEVSENENVRYALVKFIVGKMSQINFIAKQLGEFLHFKQPCEVVIDKWSPSLGDNKDFINILRDVMSSPNKPFILPARPEPSFDLPFPPIGFEYRNLTPSVQLAPSAPPELVEQSLLSISSTPDLSEPREPRKPSIMDYIDMSKVDTIRAKRSVATMKVHIREYGSHPDFANIHTQKNRAKIHNYMKSTLAIPHMTVDEALYIASQLP
jgi:hypothetical protein